MEYRVKGKMLVEFEVFVDAPNEDIAIDTVNDAVSIDVDVDCYIEGDWEWEEVDYYEKRLETMVGDIEKDDISWTAESRYTKEELLEQARVKAKRHAFEEEVMAFIFTATTKKELEATKQAAMKKYPDEKHLINQLWEQRYAMLSHPIPKGLGKGRTKKT